MSGAYAHAAKAYNDRHWPAPLPIRDKKDPSKAGKNVPPKGYSGRHGEDPSRLQIEQWAEELGHLNIGLRLPRGVIGIDVDARDGGGDTLDELIAVVLATADPGEDGRLPETYISTARTDGVSGIRLFRVDPNLTWRDPGPGVQIIRHDHRFAVVWPSIHPELARRYEWYLGRDPVPGTMLMPGPSGALDIPDLEEIPWLPNPWVSVLQTAAATRRLKRSRDDDDRVGERAADGTHVDRDKIVAGDTSDYSCQRDALISLMASLWAANTPIDEVKETCWTAAQRFRELRHDDPWRRHHIEELVDDWTGRHRPGSSPREPESSDLQDWAKQQAANVKEANAKEAKVREIRPGAQSQPPVEQRPAPPDVTPEHDDGDAGRQPPTADVVVVRGPEELRELRTDLGNAQRLARVLDVRHVKGLGWFVPLGDGTYEFDSRDRIVDLFKTVILDIRHHAQTVTDTDERDRWARWAIECESAGRIDAAIRLSRAEPGVAITVDDLNTNPLLLATRSGIVDLTTRGLARDVTDVCTQRAGVAFDPAAGCPAWLQHIAFVSTRSDGQPDPALAAYLQRWAGYTITGLVSEQKFAFLYGGGSNGKNVFVETIMKVLGTYARYGSAQLLSGRGNEHETIIADLAGPRMVFIDETPSGRVNEARLKKLTGTGKVTARRIARDPFEFTVRCKIWIAGNNKPRIAETSDGMWRRLALVPFDNVIPADRRVRDYADVLVATEGPGILNWCLEGVRGYLELNDLGAPDRVTAATDVYRVEEDPFGMFAAETFAVGSSERAWHPNKLIIGAYREWCQENGLDHPKGMRSITNDLHRLGFDRDDTPRRVLWYMQGSKIERGWFGPPLLAEAPVQLQWSAPSV
jgi:putative DNA primase/helicase